jgi:hypothetical protein
VNFVNISVGVGIKCWKTIGVAVVIGCLGAKALYKEARYWRYCTSVVRVEWRSYRSVWITMV